MITIDAISPSDFLNAITASSVAERKAREIADNGRHCLGPGPHGGGCDKRVTDLSPYVRMCKGCKRIMDRNA